MQDRKNAQYVVQNFVRARISHDTCAHIRAKSRSHVRFVAKDLRRGKIFNRSFDAHLIFILNFLLSDII